MPQQKFYNESNIDYKDYEEEIKELKIMVPPPENYAQIEKSLNKTTAEIQDSKTENIEVDDVKNLDVDDYDNDDDDQINIINITPSYPRGRLRRQIRNRDNKGRDQPYITRINPAHPRYRMSHIASRTVRKKYKKIRQNKNKKIKKATKIAIDELKKSKHIQTNDTETVDYNNDININDIQTVDYNNDVNCFDLDSNVEFIKQVPVHPRQRLA